MKSYRLTSTEQEKVYAVVVTSILATLPDGYNCDDIQFQASNSPSAWYSNYWYNETSDVFCEKLDSDALKDCINEMSRDEQVLNELFEDELRTELETVFNDIDDELKDSIDIKVEESSAKKIRLCEKGHENVILRKNRKFCSSKNCKALLTLKSPEENKNRSKSAFIPETTISPEEQRSIY